MTVEEMAQDWVAKVRRTQMSFEGNHMVYDAQAVEEMIAEILRDGFKAGVEAGTHVKQEPRVIRKFSFDTPKLQGMARKKMLDDGLTWQQVADATGVTVAPLKSHLGDKPPAEMGLKVVVSLLAWLGEFDLLGFIEEERVTV